MLLTSYWGCFLASHCCWYLVSHWSPYSVVHLVSYSVSHLLSYLVSHSSSYSVRHSYEFKNIYFYTLLILKLCPKNHFSEKMTKLWFRIFVPKMNDLLWFSIRFWIFSPKKCQNSIIVICDNSVFNLKSRFLARKFKLFR